MSKLFKLSNTEQDKTLTIKNERDIDIITKLLCVGKELNVQIKSMELSTLENKKNCTDYKLKDFPNFYAGMLLANKEAKDVLEPHIKDCGDWCSRPN